MSALSDEDYALLSQDIPSHTDPFIKQFLDGSAALQSREAPLRSDAAFRNSLSPIARRAAAIVSRVIGHENAQSQRNPTPSTDGTDPESSPLWPIVQRMPKGACLQTHLEHAVDASHVIDMLLSTPGMHVAASQSLSSADARRDAEVKISFRKGEEGDQPVWHELYAPGKWQGVRGAAETFPDGGKEGFRSWMVQRCSLPDESRSSSQRCGKSLRLLQSIICYEPIFRAFVKKLLENLNEDAVSWAELR